VCQDYDRPKGEGGRPGDVPMPTTQHSIAAPMGDRSPTGAHLSEDGGLYVSAKGEIAPLTISPSIPPKVRCGPASCTGPTLFTAGGYRHHRPTARDG